MRVILLVLAAVGLVLLNGSGAFISFFKAEPLPRRADLPTFQPVPPGLAGSRNNFPGDSDAFSRPGELRQSGFIHQRPGFDN